MKQLVMDLVMTYFGKQFKEVNFGGTRQISYLYAAAKVDLETRKKINFIGLKRV